MTDLIHSRRHSSTAPMNSATGFIITRRRLEYAGKIFLEYWLSTDDGPVKLVTPEQCEVFFIRQIDALTINQLLVENDIIFECKNLEMIDFENQKVSALYFKTGSDFYQARDLLKENSLVSYENDIRLSDRFLMERFVCGSAQFVGVLAKSFVSKGQFYNPREGSHSSASYANVPSVCYQNAQLKTASYTPSFRVLSLDIECSEYGELYSIGLAMDDYQCVLMIGAEPHRHTSAVSQISSMESSQKRTHKAFQDGTQEYAQATTHEVFHDEGGYDDTQDRTPAWIVWCDDEKALLIALIQQIARCDPDIFIGWNVVNFDFRLLLERARIHHIQLTLGRDNGRVYWRDAVGEVNKGYVSMAGRLVIDGIDALKTATYHFASFSLEFVSQELLGKGKLTEDPDDRMAAITRDFHHNKVQLAKYNLQDCLLVLDIFAKTKLLEFLTLRSQLTGLELDRVGGSVAAFLNLYLPKLHRAGYVSPNRPQDGGLASPGGYVMDSQPGLYHNVLVLDFKSLYPSIIRTFKIDPMGLIEGLKKPDDAIAGFKGAVFSRDKHFLPDIITSLWGQRDEAKKNKDSARSQAIKILMNSFYGVLGSGGCPFYDTRLASSITMRGHDIMQITATWIEEAGYTVIYGDTDSTFVWLGDDEIGGSHSAEQAFAIGEQLQKDINQKWNKKIDEEFSLVNYLEIEFETYFSRFLMPTIRGSEVGSKKRYAGIQETLKSNQKPPTRELIFKGLETVRSDWTPLAKRFQHTLFDKIFSDQDVREYIQKIISDTQQGLLDHELVYRKRLRRKLDHYVKNVPPHVKAARQADAINAKLNKSQRYQHKGWISYVITINGPEAVEHRQSLIDYDHYIEKQIRPIAEGILPFVGESFDDISSLQMGLFK